MAKDRVRLFLKEYRDLTSFMYYDHSLDEVFINRITEFAAKCEQATPQEKEKLIDDVAYRWFKTIQQVNRETTNSIYLGRELKLCLTYVLGIEGANNKFFEIAEQENLKIPKIVPKATDAD